MEYPYEKEPDFSSLTATLQQLSEVEEQPERDHGPPPDRNPAHVYLQSLGQGTPRRTMASALELAARLLRREQMDARTFPWQQLRYAEVHQAENEQVQQAVERMRLAEARMTEA